MTLIALDAPTLADALGPRIPKTTPYTQRELVIGRAIADGKTDNEISRQLGRSRTTIHEAVSGLLQKTGCRNRAHLAAHLLRTGKIT